MSIDIVYETHWLTTDNEAGIATGWLPGKLSPTGRDLARQLGQRRRDDNIAAVFRSDLARAVETARIAFADADIPIQLDARLRECDFGTLNGVPVERLAAERPHRIDTPFPSGQSYRQVVEQTRDLLRELAATRDGQRLLLIAHSANRHALDHLVHGTPLRDPATPNAGTRLGVRPRSVPRFAGSPATPARCPRSRNPTCCVPCSAA